MTVRRTVPKQKGIYFITFTCYHWKPLIEITNSYDIIYNWFNYLQSCGHKINAYAIMPNHLHFMVYIHDDNRTVNQIVGGGKRMLAYQIVNRLKKLNQLCVLHELQMGVTERELKRNKKHMVWEESFDCQVCVTPDYTLQKLIYINNNPCAGKWKLASDITRYEHSSARYYITGKHAGFVVTDIDDIILPY